MLLSCSEDTAFRHQVLEDARQGGAPVADDDAALFLSLSVLLFIGSQHGRFHAEEWFHERMAYWCRTLFVHGRV